MQVSRANRPKLLESRVKKIAAASSAFVPAAGIFLVLAPLLGGSAVLFLDWSAGSRLKLVTASWGLGGGNSGAPFDVLVKGLFSMPQGEALRVLPIGIAMMVAYFAFARSPGESVGGRLCAWSLLVINPFFYNRALAGHMGLLLGLVMIPMLIALTVPIKGRSAVKVGIGAGILMAGLVALSPHYVFILTVLLLGIVASRALAPRGALTSIVVALLVVGLISTYWILPSISHIEGDLERVTSADLVAFRSAPDAELGLLPNVAALYGFWHREWPLPKDDLPGWWLFFLAMFFVICIGAGLGVSNPERRRLSLTMIISGAAGFFLALGDQGPTGTVFLWMFNHVPGFKIMREPQKFLGLLVLAYAFFYGIGSQWLIDGFRKKSLKAAMALLLIALPCVYTYKMFWGFNGYVKPSKFPDSWAQADKAMGEGQQKALALPWHLYMAFPWTQNRLVANPMGSYFRRETIIGDNIELGKIESQSTNPRSTYIEFLITKGNQTTKMGNLLAPLGIKYVLLSKEQDWRDYRWMESQTDMRLVKEWSDLRLYENLAEVPLAYSVESSITFKSLDDLVSAAHEITLTDYAIRVERSTLGIRTPSTSPGQPLFLNRHSPVEYEITEAGSGPFIVFAEPFDGDWSIGEAKAFPNLGATNGFEAKARRGETIYFSRWPLLRTGYWIGGVTLVFLLAWLVLTRRSSRKNGRFPLTTRTTER